MEPTVNPPKPPTAEAEPKSEPKSAPWRGVIVYTPTTAMEPAVDALYMQVSQAVRPLGISITSSAAPHGEVTLFNEDIEPVGAVNMAPLVKGSYGWVLVEAGRTPQVVENPGSGDSATSLHDAIEGYFKLTVPNF